MTRILTSALLSLAVTGFAWAEGGAGGSRRWEVQPVLTTDQHGATFRVTGQMPGMPDGATLHITLTTPGTGPLILKAAFFKVAVKNEAFSGSFHWPKQKFAPLVYTTTVDLYVQTQPAQVRRVLMQEFGYPATGRETIAEEITEIGDAETRVAHSVLSLNEMTELTHEARGLHTLYAEMMALPVDAWEAKWPEVDTVIRDFQGTIEKYKREYVIRREADLVDSIRATVTLFYDVVEARSYNPEDTMDARVRGIGNNLDRIEAEIESRLPLSSLENEQLDEGGE